MKAIFDLCDMKYSSNEDYFSFYVRFRSRVCDLLRKKGDKIDFLNNQRLLEDEVLSPTFEDVIILWCLDKIDPQLQQNVKESFSVKLSDNATLTNFKKSIFASCGGKSKPDDDFEVVTLDDDDDDVDDEEVTSCLKHLEQGSSNKFIPQTRVKLQESHIQTNLHVEEVYEDEEPVYSNQHSTNNLQSHEYFDEEGEEVALLRLQESEVVECANTFPSSSQRKSQVYRTLSSECNLSFSCNVCATLCSDQVDLEQHMTSHFKNPEICQFCHKGFSSHRNLTIHIKRTHDDRPVTCHICAKVFKNKNSMKFHTWSHFNKGVPCVVCKDVPKFCSQSSFKEHLESSHNLSYEDYFKSIHSISSA